MNMKTLRLLETNIDKYCKLLSLDENIKNDALSIINNFERYHMITVLNIDRYTAAFIIIACKRNNIPMTANNINNHIHILNNTFTKSEVLINRTVKTILRETEALKNKNITSISLEKYVNMTQNRVGSSDNSRIRATAILDYLNNNNIHISDNYPILAVSIVFISDRIEGYETEKLATKNYYKILGISEVSIRKYNKKLVSIIPNLYKYKRNYKWVDVLNKEKAKEMI